MSRWKKGHKKPLATTQHYHTPSTKLYLLIHRKATAHSYTESSNLLPKTQTHHQLCLPPTPQTSRTTTTSAAPASPPFLSRKTARLLKTQLTLPQQTRIRCWVSTQLASTPFSLLQTQTPHQQLSTTPVVTYVTDKEQNVTTPTPSTRATSSTVDALEVLSLAERTPSRATRRAFRVQRMGRPRPDKKRIFSVDWQILT